MAVTFSRPSLFLMTLTDLRSIGQVSARMSLSLGMLMFFSLRYTGIMIMAFGEEDHRREVPSLTHCIKGTCYQQDFYITIDVDLDHPVCDSVCQVSLLYSSFLLPPPSIICSLKTSWQVHPTFKGCKIFGFIK